jgi:hypothetical protein
MQNFVFMASFVRNATAILTSRYCIKAPAVSLSCIFILFTSLASAQVTATATPVFSPAAGTYSSAQTVTIGTATPSATIYYTTNATTPTINSAVYSGPIVVSSSQTVEAIATASGLSSSAVSSAAYSIGAVAAPSCSGMSLGNNGSLNGFVPFPPSNAWNTNIVSAPVDPNSAAIVSASGFTGWYLHPGFGSAAGDGGIPYVVVDSTATPTVPINVIDSASQSDVVVAPYPVTAPIEGNPADCSGWPDTYNGDAHVLVLDRAKCELYETYNTNRCNGHWDASSETIWDMHNSESRPFGWTSADAAGLAVFPGLVRYDEIASGAIKHALRFTLEQTKNDANNGYFVLPATHAAGNNPASGNVIGMRIRLKPSFDISGFSPVNQIILTAMQQYGLILADNGPNFYFQGASDPRFDDSDLANLGQISSSNFEVVQAAPEFPGYDSATAPKGAAPAINSFSASALSVSAGNPFTLTYSASGDSYDYIDMIGPVSGGSVTITPTRTNTYTLFSTNAYGRSVSTPITVTVPGSVVTSPVFTPAAGAYNSAQTVTINTPTSPSAAIFYTTDGSTPTTSSTEYSGSITVSATQTLKAIARVTGYSAPSAVSSAAYTVGSTSTVGSLAKAKPAATPAISQGPALVNHAVGPSGSTSAVNMTGANFIAVCENFEYGSPSQISDSSGNTYTLAYNEPAGGYTNTALYVAFNPIVTSSMTFTTLVAGWPIGVMGFSGVGSGLDQTNGFSTDTTPNLTGSITPANAHELIVSCYGGTSSGTPSASVTPLTLVDTVGLTGTGTPQQAFVGDAYELQTAPTTVNASWTNTQNASASIIASFYAAEAPSSMVATSTNLPEGFVSTAYGSTGSIYSNQLTATGGVQPYNWTVSAGALPAGLSVSGSGLITGTPTTAVSADSVTFKVTDSTSPTPQTATVTLPITIASTVFSGGAGTCTGSALTGTQNQAYSGCALRASGGTGPYAYNYSNTVSVLATTTANSTTVSVPEGTGQLAVGMSILSYGDIAQQGLPIGAIITAIPSSTTITLSEAATATNTSPYLLLAAYPWVNANYATLPEGLILNGSTGAITGATIGGQGDYLVQMLIQDSLGTQATLTLQYLINGNNVTSCLPWAGSIFNQNISSLPVDTSPAAPVSSAYASATIKPFFGASPGGQPNGIPFLVVPYSQGLVSVATDVYGSYFTEGAWPWYAPVEDTANGHVTGQDDHSLIIQSAGGGNQCQLWEMWQAFNLGVAGTNGPWADDSNFYLANIGSSGAGAYAMPPQGKGSVDAAGLPVTPLLVNYDEVAAGAVQHPIRFTVNGPLHQYVWPATSVAGYGYCTGGYEDSNYMLKQSDPPTSCTQTMPYGEIYRLKSSVANPSCASTSPQAAVIITAMRNYGIILADGGYAGGLIGTPDARWNDTDLSCLRNLTLSNFEPVNVSSLAVNVVTSYQTTSSTSTPTAATPTFSPAAGTYSSAQTVTVSSATPSATIYYTTNGTTPTTGSAVYSGPITVSSTETLQAIAVATGYSTSATGSAAYIINLTQAATPTFSPAAGTYSSAQTVTIGTATPSATIYYTTNGSTPTTSSSVYSSPITVSASETLEAIAVATGYSTSATGSAAYTINLTQAATPTFSPAAGTYSSAQTVTVSSATPSATIYYTTNGTAPTTSSAVYSGPITVSSSETVEAIAVATGYSNSATGSASYTINLAQAATPTFSPAAGTYSSAQTVTIGTVTPLATIYYTTNGTAPTTSSAVYSGPITVSSSETVQAIAVATGYSTSATGSASYTINLTQAATPTFSPAAGTYSSAQTVTIGTATPSATIYYTTNGATPTTSSAVYSGPITVSATETVEAIAVATSYSTSATGSASYTISLTQTATPTFSPAAGTYSSSQTVTIGTATPSATIYYTTNGTTPTTSSAVYSGPITVSSSETVEAIAVATGYSNSAVGSAAYTISLTQAATPAFSPAAGTYSSAQTVTVSSATPSATIYYTTNGSTPTTSSAVYSGPITVSSSETVEAIAVATGYSTSATGSASYTINLAQAATPTFSPGAGTYSSAQTVTISTVTPLATIYYTTNGAAPTTSSQVYSGPITVSATETVEAISVATGYSTSATGSASYTINLTQAATPTFSPAAGTYSSAQTVTVSSATPAATIYYTTNGSAPTTGSAVYAGPITVSSSETVEAIAVATGYSTSATGSASYSINLTQAATPTFSPAAGTYSSAQTVTIGTVTPLATIYYTTNGAAPTTSSAVYSGPITVSATETVDAIAVATSYSTSATGSASYTISLTQTATPTFSPAAGTYSSAQTVTIGTATPSATIYYTTNGTTPTTSSAVYSGPITVSSSETVEAIAVAAGYSTSATGSAAYSINLTQAATPTFSPGAGTYSTTQTVTVSSATPAATIYYTTNGSAPTTGSAVYSGPITVSSSETVQAIAVATSYSTSAVGSAGYTINLTQVAPPSFTVAVSPASVTVTAGQSGSTTILVVPQNAFGGAVSFSCSGLPAGASCSFSPATVTTSGTVASTTLTVTTATTTAALHRNPGPLFPGSVLAVALCWFGWKKRRGLQMVLLMLVALGLSLCTGCSLGVWSNSQATGQATATTVTVIATSGSLQPTTNFTLMVQ